MPANDAYYRGLVVASMLRVGLLIGVLAVMAITFLGCSVPKATDILPRMSADADISRREGTQTRNDEPPSGGCHEKSDSSLRKPVT